MSLLTLSSSSGMDLSLEDKTSRGVEGGGDLGGGGSVEGDVSLLDANSESSHEILALVFMEIEESLALVEKVEVLDDSESLGEHY
jgi:hypothetical protein